MQELTAADGNKAALYEAILYPGVDNFGEISAAELLTQQAGHHERCAMLAHPELDYNPVQPLQRHRPNHWRQTSDRPLRNHSHNHVLYQRTPSINWRRLMASGYLRSECYLLPWMA